jgi:hypothetical protein
MKRRDNFLIILLAFLILFTNSCNPSSSTLKLPDLNFSDIEMNQRFILEAPKGLNTFKIGEIISLIVDVKSNDQIAFENDYGARIFLLEDTGWVEIPNHVKYPVGQILLSESKGDPFQKGEADIVPKLEDETNSVTLRIILIGNIYRDGKITKDQTAAYIDIELEP